MSSFTKKVAAEPAGIIKIWSGAIVDIPAGWAYCDGSSGTPDLRDRFVVCAGPVRVQGTTGGTTNHTHAFVGSTHRHTITNTITSNMTGAGGPTPPVNTGYTVPAGTNNPTEHTPVFFALAYIMKL